MSRPMRCSPRWSGSNDQVGPVAVVTEMRLYDLRVTVEHIDGRSVCGLEVGDFFEVTESSRVRILSLIHI